MEAAEGTVQAQIGKRKSRSPQRPDWMTQHQARQAKQKRTTAPFQTIILHFDPTAEKRVQAETVRHIAVFLKQHQRVMALTGQALVRAVPHRLHHQRTGDADEMTARLRQTNVEIGIFATAEGRIKVAQATVGVQPCHLRACGAGTVSVLRRRTQQNPLGHRKARRGGAPIPLSHGGCNLFAAIGIDQAPGRVADDRPLLAHRTEGTRQGFLPLLPEHHAGAGPSADGLQAGGLACH